MPAHLYLDDLIISTDNRQNFLALMASIAVIADLGGQAEVGGSPAIFRPVNPSPFVAGEFLRLFNVYLARLVAADQAADEFQWPVIAKLTYNLTH